MDRPAFEEIRPRPLPVIRDARGRLVKVFPPPLPPGGEVYFVTFAEGAPRGGHYHTGFRERFVPVRGRVRCDLADPLSGLRARFLLDGDRPEVLDVAAGIAHRFRAETPGAVLLVLADRAELPGGEDRIPYAFGER